MGKLLELALCLCAVSQGIACAGSPIILISPVIVVLQAQPVANESTSTSTSWRRAVSTTALK